ncbi:MAG: starch-binding protein [Muribaculaceae bacterium]|nr:starch-binding protein [Muribaculaceae bacterium]
MKNIFKGLATLLILGSFTGTYAQGWPENYEGVMLQGFYWDSYNDTHWTNLEAQADELSKYFDLIWIPNSANSDGGMGYMPVYWFSNYNSAFGTEAELRSMIKTFKAKGTGFIADVVVNHRNGNNSAWDFPAETYNGKVYDMADGSIVSNDNIWSNLNGWGKGCPESYKGAADTGDLFDGCRDLDHTNTTVQEHIKAYTEFLIKELDYVGFRYDMVKGYDGKYTKIYNEYSKPSFSVGEFWDSYDPIAAWIDKTGKTSAAFDFPCKQQLNDAFNGGLKLEKLTWTNPSNEYQPAGLIHYNYRQYAVTFVDNHDTSRDGNCFTDTEHVLAANAFILSSPGTPCVFLPHYLENKVAIKEMINARKMAGITNTSNVKVFNHSNTCYLAEVTGKRGTLAVKIGSDWISPEGYTDDDIVAAGNDYCIWVKSDGSYIAPNPADDPETYPQDQVENGITIYYNDEYSSFKTVYCYSYANNADNGKAWPGYKMTHVGGYLYSVVVPQGSNVVFNSGYNGAQTVDVLNVKDGYVYTSDSANSTGKFKVDNGKLFDGLLPIPSKTLFINGTYNGWDSKLPKEMDHEFGHYTLRNFTMTDSSGDVYFSFAAAKGDWDTVNQYPRYGAESNNLEVTAISDSEASSPTYKMKEGDTYYNNAWKAKSGTYDIVVEPGSWTLTLYEAGKAPDYEVNIFDKDDEETQPGDQNPGEGDSTVTPGDGDESKPGDQNPGGGSTTDPGQGDETKPGDQNPGGGSTTDPGQGDETKPGDQNPGGSDDSNPGDQNPGGGSTTEPGQGDETNPDDQNPGGGSTTDPGQGDDSKPGDQNPGGDPTTPPADDDDQNEPELPSQDPDAIEGIQADEAQPVFFNLNGLKVENPSNGIFIKVTGNKRQKVVIR